LTDPNTTGQAIEHHEVGGDGDRQAGLHFGVSDPPENVRRAGAHLSAQDFGNGFGE
jgi:hypothetical protein